MSSMRTLLSTIASLLAFMMLAQSACAAPLTWKPVTSAFLRVNDQGAKEWSVFRVEKKDGRYLLQLADRFLLVDVPQRQVFDLPAAEIERTGSDILWDPSGKPAKPLATSSWLVRDVGLAQRIKTHLDAEDRTLDLQIPHSSTR